MKVALSLANSFGRMHKSVFLMCFFFFSIIWKNSTVQLAFKNSDAKLRQFARERKNSKFFLSHFPL